MTSPRLAGALLGVLLGLLVSSCHSRLPPPQRTFLSYPDPPGQPFPSKITRAIVAPDYNRILRARGVLTPSNEGRDLAGEVSIIDPTGNRALVPVTGDERLGDVLERSGVLDRKSEWNEIAIIRHGEAVRERYVVVADLEQLFRYGDLDQDVRLRGGDVVFIPFERNTLLDEIWASIGLLAKITPDANTITEYIDYVEGF